MTLNPTSNTTRFEGTDQYIATDDLKLAVNAALALERPLLIKGEPGTGKTMLAEQLARALGRPLLQWHVKSTTKAHQGRRRIAPARLPVRRRKSSGHRKLHCERGALGGV